MVGHPLKGRLKYAYSVVCAAQLCEQHIESEGAQVLQFQQMEFDMRTFCFLLTPKKFYCY